MAEFRFRSYISAAGPLIGSILSCLWLCSFLFLGAGFLSAQVAGFDQQRENGSVVIEPYAPNIVRVTLGLDEKAAKLPPGYGMIGQPSAAGWSQKTSGDGSTIFRSDRLVVRLSPDHPDPSQQPRPMPLDKLNMSLRDHYFNSNNQVHDGNPDHRFLPHSDRIRIDTADGQNLVDMQSWLITPRNVPNEASEDVYKVQADFHSFADEHYYGLGQHQLNFLDLRGHRIDCWHNYNALGGETLCVPFMVSSRGYGLVWDNPSRTTVDVGVNDHTRWSSDVGDRVSFFVIAGKTTDEIYAGYRQLTGVTHLLPKSTYGFIQSKAIYGTEEQLMSVADGYRKRKIPADVLVVDFLNMTRQGEMDLDPKRWPAPAAMNDNLHSMGFTTLLSVWPHFSEGTQFYDMLKAKGWLIHRPDGTPDSTGYTDQIGPNIDTTNPEAARWFWEKIRDRYINKDHFDYIWLDETEPDVDPINDVFHVGSGARFYNVYPLFHTASVYDGIRRDFGDSRRCMVLARAAYLGAQRNCSVFWSSDIVSDWDMLRRSIPAGLDFTASGLPYWDTDIAGFFSPHLPADYKPAHPPLIDGSDAEANIDRYTDYPELFVRWFQWGSFQPVMRAHGERDHNEAWSYGKQAEGILTKYLRLRYELLPYIYSAAYHSYQTGAPYMRALPLDFGADPKTANITDEYMFGPAFLVAPVVEQGATEREVYLPAGAGWVNYWTHERFKGGQTIIVSAPIDTLPLFVRAGSIIPFGSTIQSTREPQSIAKIRVYGGHDADFQLYADDGTTYNYEKTGGALTNLHWDDAKQQLSRDGQVITNGKDVEIIH